MIWEIKFSEIAAKQLQKIDKAVSKRILKYLKECIIKQTDPRTFGKPLLPDKTGLWRYRVDDYRIICNIQDNTLTVLVLRVGHRNKIYDE